MKKLLAFLLALSFGAHAQTLVNPLQGGTGVSQANTKTITLGGPLVTSGANSLTLTTTGATNVTLPTSGTLATTAGSVATATNVAGGGNNQTVYNTASGTTSFFTGLTVSGGALNNVTALGATLLGTLNTSTSRLDVKSNSSAPATSGTTPVGALGLWSGTLSTYFGNFTASPYAGWVQVSDYTNLATTGPFSINPRGGNVGINNINPATALDVTGALTVSTNATVTGNLITTTQSPASGAACTAGTLTWDASYLYVCTASGAWKRVAVTGGY